MRENRPYGSEGGGSRATGPPYPYRADVASRLRTHSTNSLQRRLHDLAAGLEFRVLV